MPFFFFFKSGTINPGQSVITHGNKKAIALSALSSEIYQDSKEDISSVFLHTFNVEIIHLDCCVNLIPSIVHQFLIVMCVKFYSFLFILYIIPIRFTWPQKVKHEGKTFVYYNTVNLEPLRSWRRRCFKLTSLYLSLSIHRMQ